MCSMYVCNVKYSALNYALDNRIVFVALNCLLKSKNKHK